MRQRIDARSAAQNLTESRLPSFTEEEKEEIKGVSIVVLLDLANLQLNLFRKLRFSYH